MKNDEVMNMIIDKVYSRIALEQANRWDIVNHKKVKCLMSIMGLYGKHQNLNTSYTKVI